jgi:hypothetical protein
LSNLFKKKTSEVDTSLIDYSFLKNEDLIISKNFRRNLSGLLSGFI